MINSNASSEECREGLQNWSNRSCALAVSVLKILPVLLHATPRDESSAPIDLVYVFVLEHPQTGNAMYLLDDSASDGK